MRKRLPEVEARLILKQIIEGIRDYNNVNIIHRDLKLANILLHFPEKDLLSMSKEERLQFIETANLKENAFEVKISDFGFAKQIQSKSRQHNQTICGTPIYMAPDVFLNNNSNYSEKLDIWSLGAMFYELLVGQTPFLDRTHEGLSNKMREGFYEFPAGLNVSAEAIHFISKCL